MVLFSHIFSTGWCYIHSVVPNRPTYQVWISLLTPSVHNKSECHCLQTFPIRVILRFEQASKNIDEYWATSWDQAWMFIRWYKVVAALWQSKCVSDDGTACPQFAKNGLLSRRTHIWWQEISSTHCHYHLSPPTRMFPYFLGAEKIEKRF